MNQQNLTFKTNRNDNFIWEEMNQIDKINAHHPFNLSSVFRLVFRSNSTYQKLHYHMLAKNLNLHYLIHMQKFKSKGLIKVVMGIR